MNEVTPIDRMEPDIGLAHTRAVRSSRSGSLRSFRARKAALLAMRRMVEEGEAMMAEALAKDMGRSAGEAWTSELTTLHGEITHALSNLKRWMKPERASVPFVFKPAKASIRYEPKGAALIIGAWNLPFAVTLAPAVAAIAAGNAVVVKPSELAPASAMAMAELVRHYIEPKVLQVVEGDAETTKALLAKRWDHVFFTGGQEVGRKVAEAAARFGTPVTLEHGGKCPAYVHRSADLKVAARRIVWGKFMNAGQVCIAPDFAIVDAQVYNDFLDQLWDAIAHFFGPDPKKSADFARIINERHFDRLETLLETTSGRITIGGERDRSSRYIGPSVVIDIAHDDALMQHEIFGPLLPILSVDNADEALDVIAGLPEPLAVYPFASDRAVLARFETTCRTGAVVSNDVTVNHAVRSLPFGGVGPSGHGTYHGVHGFRTFSYPKAVLRRGTGSDPDLRYPPYTRSKIKWLKRLG